MQINDPIALSELEAAFAAYELALTGNDVPELDRLFWDSAHTVRYGATENLQGMEMIRAFRTGRPGKNLAREILSQAITTFGRDFGVANIVFSRVGQTRLGRQSQSWVRMAGVWQVVAAHVSWMDA